MAEQVIKSEKERGRSGALLPAAVAVLAVCCLFALLLAGFGTRLGIWEFRTGFAILKAAAYCGLALVVIAVLTLYRAAQKRRGMGVLFSVLAIGAAAVAVALPVSWAVKASRVPRIHDISTDLNNPPPFVALAPERPGRVQYEGAEAAAEQQKAYPDLKTVLLDMPAQQAFARALDTAKEMGWDIAAEVPVEGRIEATATTFWFGFHDDISIRVVPAGVRSLLDVRSSSRVGISDVGTNAARIREFLKKFNAPVPSPSRPS